MARGERLERMTIKEDSVARGQDIKPLWEHESLLEFLIVGASLALLVLSCADQALVGSISKVLWVASVGGLAAINLALAFALYVFSVAIFSGLHFSSWGSLLERPDNFALAVLLLSFLFGRLRRRDLIEIGYLEILAILFIAYGLGQLGVSGTMDRANFAWFMRTYGLPFMMFFLLKGSAVSRDTLRRFMAIMIALGIYMAVVSVMEQMNLWDYIIPAWVANPEMNVSKGVRSGGLVMQPEFNGLALNLVYCILLGSIHWYRKGHPLVQAVGGALILLAVFFTYTRAAWIGTLLASLVLLFGGQASPWKRAGVVLTGLAILALLFLFPSKVGSERAEDTNSIYFRFKVWTAGLNMATVNPIFGQGFGSFSKNVSRYQTEAVDYRDLPETGTLAHNTILNILVEQGALGLILYLFVLGGMVVKAKQGMAVRWPRGSLVWVSTFASAYFFNVLFVNAHFPAPNLIFYGVLGMLSGLKKIETGEMGGEGIDSDQGKDAPKIARRL